MSKRVWLITDTHFYHHKLVEWGERPEGFEKLIIDNWRFLVQPTDLVIHLGDVYFGKGSEFEELMVRLPGKKVLIRGNHDRERTAWYMRRGFEVVTNYLSYRHVLLTHRPALFLGPDVELNVHGHLHGNKHRLLDSVLSLTGRHKELALEKTGYKPVLFEEFIYGNNNS